MIIFMIELLPMVIFLIVGEIVNVLKQMLRGFDRPIWV